MQATTVFSDINTAVLPALKGHLANLAERSGRHKGKTRQWRRLWIIVRAIWGVDFLAHRSCCRNRYHK
jgi:hypothetical protein